MPAAAAGGRAAEAKAPGRRVVKGRVAGAARWETREAPATAVDVPLAAVAEVAAARARKVGREAELRVTALWVAALRVAGMMVATLRVAALRVAVGSTVARRAERDSRADVAAEQAMERSGAQ